MPPLNTHHESERDDVPGAQALLKGLDILLAIGSAPAPMRFRDIEAAVTMPRASLHRLLAALVSRNLVRYDQRKRLYEVGTKVLELSRRTLDRNEIIRAAKPEMARLARLLQRTICLMVADRHEVFVLDFEDADSSYGRLVRLWPRLRLTDCAAGRAILSSMPRDQAVKAAMAAADGQAPNDRLMADIDVGKALGYCVLASEQPSGHAAAGTAILDENGFPVAALSCLFDAGTAYLEGLHETGRMLAEAGRRASRQIGIGPEAPFVVSRPAGLPDSRLEVLPTGRDFVGESPLWDHARRRLFWIDVLSPALRWWDPLSRNAGRMDLPGVTAGLALGADGRLFACGHGGFGVIDPDTGSYTRLFDPEAASPDNRFNTAGVDQAGRMWAATMALDHKVGKGALYSLDRDLIARKHMISVGMPKNPVFSRDGSRMYLPDAALPGIRCFDFDAVRGDVGEERPFLTVDPAEGRPNGVAIDAEDHLWVTWLGGWSLRRYDPDGRLVETIRLPVPMPTSCAFGGPELDTLYITSTYIRMPAGMTAQAPAAGQLLSLKLRPLGLSPRAFGGAEGS